MHHLNQTSLNSRKSPAPNRSPADPHSKNGNYVVNIPGPRRVPPSPSACTMRVVGLNASRQILVASASSVRAIPARLLKNIRREELFDAEGLGREVLVVFDRDLPDRPIIIGVLQTETTQEPPLSGGDDLNFRTERRIIEAVAELVLKCGSGSITLRRDGKIILHGTHLLSRSSGPIRIKGGHVEIN